MAGKWSLSNAQVAVAEVQRRNDAHRNDALASASNGVVSSIDVSAFTLRDDELKSLREKLDG